MIGGYELLTQSSNRLFSFFENGETKGDQKLKDAIDALEKARIARSNTIVENIQFSYPTTTFNDVVGLEKVKLMLCQNALLISNQVDDITSKMTKFMNVKPSSNYLFYGPPGTGKSMIANAFANRLGLPMLSVCASDVLGGLVGLSEKNVKGIFERARANSPCVLFFDEAETLFSDREKDNNSKAPVTEFLNQMGGSENDNKNKGIIMIAATNLLSNIDSAIKRRFTQRVEIPLPTPFERVLLLTSLMSDLRHNLEIPDFTDLSKAMENYSNADIANYVRELAKFTMSLANVSPKEDYEKFENNHFVLKTLKVEYATKLLDPPTDLSEYSSMKLLPPCINMEVAQYTLEHYSKATLDKNELEKYQKDKLEQ